jgi:hypothetical protein
LVEFNEAETVPLALHLNGIEFGDRSMIITKFMEKIPDNIQENEGNRQIN